VIVVADAGPVLHLHWIGCLSWGLPATKVHVVEQVWLEVMQHAPQALADPRFERHSETAADPELQRRFSLQLGETAAIGFALRQASALLLTDDEAARRACSTLGLAAVGTIGLVLEAARAGRTTIAQARVALENLPTQGRLHVTRDLLARAIAALESGT
jgi:predicted nucleic acid-binding protein